MSDLPDNLLIDIGNSRIKYARVWAGQTDFELHYCEQVAELSQVIKHVKKVLVASVGKSVITTELQLMCQQSQVDFRLIHTQAQQFGIVCAYEQYATMGVDRWLAILGARTITHLPLAVLDLGTAATCDIVIGNQHIGGWIAPGFNMMKQALTSNTQKVFADNSLAHNLTMGTSTPECVNLGCLAALQGFVIMAGSYLAQRTENYQILVTGGDQDLLTQLNHANLAYFPNLVLLGLSRFVT